MSTSQTDKLFRFVSEMTASEIKQAKAILSLSESKTDKALSGLFNLYVKLKNFDENKVAALSKKLGIDSQLNKYKTLLYQKLLSFGALNEPEGNLEKAHKYVFDFHYLVSKGLYNDAQQRLNKAKKIASDFEFFEMHSYILSREHLAWPVFHTSPEVIGKLVHENKTQQKLVTEQIANAQELKSLFIQAMQIAAKTGYINPAGFEKEKSEFEFKLNNTAPISLFSEVQFHLAQTAWGYAQNQQETSVFHTNKIIEGIYKTKKYTAVYHTNQITSILQNCLLLHKKWDDQEYCAHLFNLIIDYFEINESRNKEQKKLTQNAIFYLMIENAIKQNEIATGLQLLENKSLTENHSEDQITNSPYTYHYYHGILLLLNNNPKGAIRAIQQINLKTEKNIDEFMQFEMLFILLLSHFSLGHTDSIEYVANDLAQMQKKKRFNFPIRAEIVELFKKKPFISKKEFISKVNVLLDCHPNDFFFDLYLLDIAQFSQVYSNSLNQQQSHYQ